tara:strand:- start:466 stop:1281 length:816 start_codon:yes stop_codon:yes gene_type:complete
MSQHNDTHISSQQIFLSSKHADQIYSNADCVFFLDTPIAPPRGTRILLSVTDFEIPYSFYTINSTNDKLAFVGVTDTITLEHGNYNVNTFIALINEDLADVASNITASYVTNKNHIRFNSNTSAISINTTLTTCLFELGFSSSDTQNSTQIEGTNGINLAGIPNIYIRIKNITTSNLDSKGQLASTLAKVNVNVNPLEYIFYMPREPIYQTINEAQFNSIHLSIEDEDGNKLELNGQYWSTTLSIHYQLQRQPNIVLEIEDENKKKEPDKK